MRRFFVIPLVFFTSTGFLQAEEKPATRVKDFVLMDAQGTKHTSATWKENKAVVLFFLGTECPVSNFYCPEYARIVKGFSTKAVLFYGIHADPYVTAREAAQHATEYGLRFPILLDPTHAVTRQLGVRVVPEAAVLSADGRILYCGRIDNRYNADGVRRETPTSRDLEAALRAVLAGKTPAVTRTTGFGCPLPEPAKQKK